MFITHDEFQMRFTELLAAVEEQREVMCICRDGKPVAELRAIPDPLQQHSELLGVQFLEDPTLPLSEEEWPDEFR